MPEEAPRRLLLRFWVVAHFATTLAHFVHNAVMLCRYPGLPESWTPFCILASWFLLAGPGLAGWILLDRGKMGPAASAFNVFGILGFAGLLHFLFAPPGDHSTAMLAAIGAEAFTGAGLLLTAARESC